MKKVNGGCADWLCRLRRVIEAVFAESLRGGLVGS